MKPFDADEIFDKLEAEREAGELRDKVTCANPSYQASLSHPGLIERIYKNGKRDIGIFRDGIFIPNSEI